MLSFPCPKNSLVAVGKTNTGPAAQISLCGLAGERKNVGVMSPKPNTPALFCTAWAAKYAGVFLRCRILPSLLFPEQVARSPARSSE